MSQQPFADASYGTVAEFLDSVSGGLRNPRNQAAWSAYFEEDRASWYGANCRTGRDVQSLVHTGWPDGMAMVERLLAKTSASLATPVDRRRRNRRGPQGDSLDIHAVYRGQLDVAWTRPVRTNARGPQRVDLVANMICSGAENAEVLAWRGAAAIAIADRLTAAGYQVRIIVGFGGRCSGAPLSCRITVKDHGGPLDVSTAAAVMVPGFFRALGHAWTAAHHPERIWSPGMTVQGSRTEPGEIVISHETRDQESAIATIDRVIAGVNNPDGARDVA